MVEVKLGHGVLFYLDTCCTLCPFSTHEGFMTAPKGFPDKVALLSDGWAVRFNGCIEGARWQDKGAADIHLQQLQAGTRQPQPEVLHA